MDGIIVINKEKEYTSHDVVAIVKKIVKDKVGHTGTLDPNATGVLPLLIGEGTKISKYLINHDKVYEVTLQLGIKTDTADVEGKIIQQEEVEETMLQKEKIEQIFNSIKGKQKQIPPMYSAIKVKGKKLYEYARKGQEVEIPAREIEIYAIQLLEIKKKEKQIRFEVSCSKGTYIRSLCETIAEKLETIGYMKELKRTKVGEFSIQNSITLQELQEIQEHIAKSLITIEDLFKEKGSITLNEKEVSLFLNGVLLQREQIDDVYRIYQGNTFLGLGIIQNKKLKRDVIVHK